MQTKKNHLVICGHNMVLGMNMFVKNEFLAFIEEATGEIPPSENNLGKVKCLSD